MTYIEISHNGLVIAKLSFVKKYSIDIIVKDSDVSDWFEFRSTYGKFDLMAHTLVPYTSLEDILEYSNELENAGYTLDLISKR